MQPRTRWPVAPFENGWWFRRGTPVSRAQLARARRPALLLQPSIDHKGHAPNEYRKEGTHPRTGKRNAQNHEHKATR